MAKNKKEEPKVEEFMEIGGSPMPGITLRQVIHGLESLNAWSPDGKYFALEGNGSITFWDVEKGNSSYRNFDDGLNTFDDVNIISWSPNSEDLIVSIRGRRDPYPQVGDDIPLSGTGVVSIKDGTLTPTSQSGEAQLELRSPDGYRSARGPATKITIPSKNRTEWDFSGAGNVDGYAWHPNGQMLAGRSKAAIHIWDVPKGIHQITLEGHTANIQHLSFSSDGHLLLSTSENELLVWHTDSWESTSISNLDSVRGKQIKFHPNLPLIATIGRDKVARIWEMDYTTLLQNQTTQQSIQYTTAKLVLVGDSGVGKTGLGWRLTHDEFREHSSTHGQQFWVAPALSNKREDGTECEAVVWDLAGQHVYRSIHSIFLDNVDTSIILFDPTNRQDPLKGAQFWVEQLKGNKQLPPTVLVGARVDRGAPVLSQAELDQFCQKYGISGGYIGTSAKSGEGVDILIETIKKQIPWDKMAATITTTTFKKIKEFVLALKEYPDRKGVLVRPIDLKTMLEVTDQNWKFSDAEMMTAVGHLANHGYVNILRNSSGEEYILLTVDLLAYLASSIVLLADKHPQELGAVSETDLLQGKYTFEELKGLDQKEQQVLIDAAILRFLKHNVCFRETTETDTLLVFPSLIKQKRPLQDAVPSTDGTSYIIRGSVENLYARMVVLLGYAPSFTRVNQWQNQSQFVTSEGNICGFKLIEDYEGEIELVLYYGNNMPKEERDDFQVLFERFLYQHKVEVTPFPSLTCPNGHPQERATVLKRSREGKKSLFCDECGAKTDLPTPAEQNVFDFEMPEWLKQEEAMAQLRSIYEAQIANVKSYRRDWATPRCYLSSVSEQKEFADSLKHDLSDAGILILESPAHVEENDNIVMINSQAYDNALKNNSLPDDKKLIMSRVKNKQKGLITIKQLGNTGRHDIDLCESDSFSDPTHHVINLFDLVLHLYSIPLSHAGFKELRQSLHQQWEQTLAQAMRTDKPGKEPSDNTKEIYLSYAWGGESEKFVNDLDQAIQNKGITLIRDKRNLGYKGSIKGFMERIGQGKGIVVVISDEYLKSKNCMSELIQIAANKNFIDRIFPIVLSDADIYDAINRIEYIKHWENKITELDTAMKTVSAANLHGIREDIDIFDTIRDEIAKLTDILQDMNTLTPDMHRDTDFQTLYDAVMAKLEE